MTGWCLEICEEPARPAGNSAKQHQYVAQRSIEHFDFELTCRCDLCVETIAGECADLILSWCWHTIDTKGEKHSFTNSILFISDVPSGWIEDVEREFFIMLSRIEDEMKIFEID